MFHICLQNEIVQKFAQVSSYDDVANDGILKIEEVAGNSIQYFVGQTCSIASACFSESVL